MHHNNITRNIIIDRMADIRLQYSDEKPLNIRKHIDICTVRVQNLRRRDMCMFSIGW